MDDDSAMPNDDLKFEYEQLRKEILLHNTLTMQWFGAVLVLVGTILSITLSNIVPLPLMKAGLLFFAWLVAILGMANSMDRGRSTHLIASYLRTFIEPQATIKWETRLHQLRQTQPRHGYTSFVILQLRTYILICISTLAIAGYYVLDSTNFAQLWSVAVLIPLFLLATWFVATLAVLRIAWHSHSSYENASEIGYDPLWQRVKEQEELRKSLATAPSPTTQLPTVAVSPVQPDPQGAMTSSV
jgi:hypothetical protein